MMSSRRATLVRFAISFVVSIVLPTAVFLVLPPYVGGVTVALLIGAAIPAVYVLVQWLVRRAIDPVGAPAVAAFIVEIVVFLATGRNGFVPKLQEALLTGPAGLVLLVSVLVGRPLLLEIARFAARGSAPAARSGASTVRSWTAPTVVAGVTLIAHSLTTVLLAIVLPTEVFLAVSRVVALIILAAGAVILVGIVRRRPAVAAGGIRRAGGEVA